MGDHSEDDDESTEGAVNMAAQQMTTFSVESETGDKAEVKDDQVQIIVDDKQQHEVSTHVPATAAAAGQPRVQYLNHGFHPDDEDDERSGTLQTAQPYEDFSSEESDVDEPSRPQEVHMVKVPLAQTQAQPYRQPSWSSDDSDVIVAKRPSSPHRDVNVTRRDHERDVTSDASPPLPMKPPPLDLWDTDQGSEQTSDVDSMVAHEVSMETSRSMPELDDDRSAVSFDGSEGALSLDSKLEQEKRHQGPVMGTDMWRARSNLALLTEEKLVTRDSSFSSGSEVWSGDINPVSPPVTSFNHPDQYTALAPPGEYGGGTPYAPPPVKYPGVTLNAGSDDSLRDARQISLTEPKLGVTLQGADMGETGDDYDDDMSSTSSHDTQILAYGKSGEGDKTEDADDDGVSETSDSSEPPPLPSSSPPPLPTSPPPDSIHSDSDSDVPWEPADNRQDVTKPWLSPHSSPAVVKPLQPSSSGSQDKFKPWQSPLTSHDDTIPPSAREDIRAHPPQRQPSIDLVSPRPYKKPADNKVSDNIQAWLSRVQSSETADEDKDSNKDSAFSSNGSIPSRFTATPYTDHEVR